MVCYTYIKEERWTDKGNVKSKRMHFKMVVQKLEKVSKYKIHFYQSSNDQRKQKNTK